MKGEQSPTLPGAIAALEHITGPSRGRVTWLEGSPIDLILGPDRFVRIARLEPGQSVPGLIAHIHRSADGFEIEAVEGRPVWVNGRRLSRQRLANRDMIEFGESGPLSRFCLYRENMPIRRNLGEILGDAATYLRVSRQPILVRIVNVASQVLRRLAQESTVLFRIGVIVAIVFLAVLAFQQYRMNLLLQRQIESSAGRIEDFSRAVAKARDEALTASDLAALRQELAQRDVMTEERLLQLERHTGASARVIAQSAPSIVFLQGAYAFRERSSGRFLRHVIDDDGRPLISPLGQPMLTLDGDGPVASRQFTGTAFAVGTGNLLVTNRHVARPWENDANVVGMAELDFEPVMQKFIFYRPGQAEAIEVELLQVSEEVDLALLRHRGEPGALTGLSLAKTEVASGMAVIVMGYPTGLRSLLAQTGEAFIEKLQKEETTGFWAVAARLAEVGRIAPLASRGIVSQVGPETIAYDAETTYGGSGGPVLALNGDVIAVNTAILPQFGGSNLGVPVSRVRSLLEQADTKQTE